MKWIVVWLDHDNVDLSWDEYDTEAEAKQAVQDEEGRDNRKSVTIHGTFKECNT